ncbi:hypothetical protein [Exiguobacterium sp. K1]|uniref:hypothetical protein n=1 Tax=Exiguobacterium sp. K1 TaxID=2980105 RepID=UPI00299CF11B|nr:hypothetical protein [Exiguobacterium sp. K1]MDX1260716.1 hypothetical protein [Exiguobacterium sp. K1]
MSFTKDADGFIPSSITINYNASPSANAADVISEFYVFTVLARRSNERLLQFITSPNFQNPDLNTVHKNKIENTQITVSFVLDCLHAPASYSKPKHMKKWLDSQNHYLSKMLKKDLKNEFEAIMFANDITRAFSDLKSENEEFFSKDRISSYLKHESYHLINS